MNTAVETAYTSRSTDVVPKSYRDIVHFDDDSEQWYECSDKEIATLLEKGTWELVDRPPGKPILPNMWVYRIKRNGDGSITKYKARFVVCGNRQTAGVHFHETYSPVARSETYRFFHTITAARKMQVRRMDAVASFLNGDIDSEVYTSQPQGYVNQNFPDHVLKIIKNLYGLKQAPRIWHKVAKSAILKMGFNQNPADPCLYFRWLDGELSLIQLHVDDFACASDSSASLDIMRTNLHAAFELGEDEALIFHLGISNSYSSNNTVSLHMQQYIQDLLTDYNMEDCIPIATPLAHASHSSENCPTKNSTEWHAMQKIPFRELICKLAHLSRTVRPDISFAVGVLSRFMDNPGITHWNAAKRILRYLKGRPNSPLVLEPG